MMKIAGSQYIHIAVAQVAILTRLKATWRCQGIRAEQRMFLLPVQHLFYTSSLAEPRFVSLFFKGGFLRFDSVPGQHVHLWVVIEDNMRKP